MGGIDPLNNALHAASVMPATHNLQQKRREAAKKSGVQKKSFFDMLGTAKAAEETFEDIGLPSEIAHLPYDDALEILQDTVYLTGDILKKTQDMETVHSYQQAVRNFVSFVIKNSYKIEQRLGARNKQTNLHVQYSTIKIIDEKLNSLATGVLYNQQVQLNLLAKIDEINGLLINLIT